jgi:hypothetical protein
MTEILAAILTGRAIVNEVLVGVLTVSPFAACSDYAHQRGDPS